MNYANLDNPKKHKRVKYGVYLIFLLVAFILGVVTSGKFADIKHRTQLAVQAYNKDAPNVIVVEHSIIVTVTPSPSPVLKYSY